MQREKLFFYSLCLIAFLIPFDIKITNSVIIVSFVLWLLSGWKNLRANWPDFRIYFFLFISLYLVNIPGLIHTDNLSSGFGRLESRLSYLAFPLMVFFSTLDKKQFRMIGYFFCAGTLIASMVCLVIALNTFFHTDPSARTFNQLTYLALLEPLGLHPTYVSIFASFCIFFLLEEIISHQKGLWRWALIMVTTYFAVLNFFIQSRAPLVAFLLIVTIGAIVMIFTLRNVVQKRIALVTFILIAVVVLVNTEKVFKRFDLSFDKISELVLEPDDAIDVSLSGRSTIAHLRSWYCSIQLLSDYHLLTGYGSGDEKDMLQPCYVQHNWVIMAQERQNAHNEYLSSLLRLGIPELVLLLCCLFIPLYLSVKHRYFLYTTFLLLWTMSFFFTTLNLQSAMFFYTLFNALFFRMQIVKMKGPGITTSQTTKGTLPVVS